MNTHVFLQARMGSTRFPGKVLADIGGKTVLERTIERLRQVKLADKLVLLTSTKPENDQVEAAGRRLGVPVFRGAEENTLDRYTKAARAFGSDVVVRVTADCPLLDPALIDTGILQFQGKHVDFFSNTNPLTHPHGLQFEVSKREVLELTWERERAKFESSEAFENADIVPGTPVLSDARFKKEYLIHKPSFAFIRITLDYSEDLEVIRKVYEVLPEERCSFLDIVDLFEKRPELLQISAMHNEYLKRT